MARDGDVAEATAIVETPAASEEPGTPAAREAPSAASLRKWATGWTTGVAQALGATLLLVSEFVREDVGALGAGVPAGTRLPSYAADFPHHLETLDGHGWYAFAGDAADALTLHEPRAALWAAVCAALVVRLNADGPPRTQCVLAVLGAVYCVLLVVAGVPYLALAGYALPGALVLGAVAVAAATRWNLGRRSAG